MLLVLFSVFVLRVVAGSGGGGGGSGSGGGVCV